MQDSFYRNFISEQDKVIAFIGGGGKSTLMYRLSKDCQSLGKKVIILSLFPDQYNWILNMFQVVPDFTRGINYLNELSESSSVFNREGILLFALSQSFYGDNPEKAVVILKSKISLFDKSLLFKYLLGLTSIKNRNNLEAIKVKNNGTNQVIISLPKNIKTYTYSKNNNTSILTS